MLPKVGNSLQIIPGGKVCRTEVERKSRDPREPSWTLASGGAKQLIGPRLVQPVTPQGHLAGDSNPSQVQGSVELQSQEAARDLDTKLGRSEREPSKQFVPPARAEQ